MIALTSPFIAPVRCGSVASEMSAPETRTTARFERIVLDDVPVAGVGWTQSYVFRRAPLAPTPDGGPPRRFVLLHGLGDAPVSWFRCLASALPQHELLLPAIPGIGRAPLPDGRDHLTNAESALWLDGLLYRLDPNDLDPAFGPGSGIDVAGHSLGGWLLARALLNQPDLGRFIDRPPILINNAGTWYEGIERERELLSPKRIEDLDDLFEHLYHEPPGLPVEALDALLRTMRSPSYEGILWNSHKADFLHDAQLGALPSGTGIVWGTSDRLVPPEALTQLEAHVPSPRIERIEACGHAPHFEAPDACREAIERLVASAA